MCLEVSFSTFFVSYLDVIMMELSANDKIILLDKHISIQQFTLVFPVSCVCFAKVHRVTALIIETLESTFSRRGHLQRCQDKRGHQFVKRIRDKIFVYHSRIVAFEILCIALTTESYK